VPENHVIAVPRDRWVLVHGHIFKNAGSTIESILRRSFGPRFATLHGPAHDSTIRGSELAGFLLANPEIAAVSSHHTAYPLPVIAGTILFDLCFFRNPLLRLWSMYRYFRVTQASGDLASRARSHSAPEFFDLLMAEYPHLVNDAQVTYLANGGVYTRPPTAQDLRVAMERARRISVLGVVELFDESAVTAEYFLRPTFPALRFEYVTENVSTFANDGPAEEVLRREVGGARYAQLERMNRLDAQMLAFAREELLRRFEMVPDRGQRLTSLRERCKALESVATTVYARTSGVSA
jgi:hypothetical protein